MSVFSAATVRNNRRQCKDKQYFFHKIFVRNNTFKIKIKGTGAVKIISKVILL